MAQSSLARQEAVSALGVVEVVQRAVAVQGEAAADSTHNNLLHHSPLDEGSTRGNQGTHSPAAAEEESTRGNRLRKPAAAGVQAPEDAL